jgi:hypothetical protein
MDSLDYSDTDPVEGLQAAWADERLSLAQRARLVSRLAMKSRLSLDGAARLCGTSPAHVQALLELATLDDEDLQLVSDVDPPITTWLLFAGTDSECIRAGVAALKATPRDQPVLQTVYTAMRETSGPDLDERIAAIPGETLGRLAHKAKEYGKLSPSARKFLVDVSKRKRVGSSLTERQLKWLKDVLFELVETGVVRRDSPDKDQQDCDSIMDALGI